MDDTIIFISEEKVISFLEWQSLVEVVEEALIAVSQSRAVQNPRTFTKVPRTDSLLLTMPGYLDPQGSEGQGSLACKIVGVFPKREEKKQAKIVANIILFDDETGDIKCIMGATGITAWRTAAASVVATKYLHVSRNNRECKVLAVLGAGVQGRIHAIAFQHFFNFEKIRIWNHKQEKTEILVNELMNLGIKNVEVSQTPKECVKDADVIVTATFTSTPIVHLEWVKPNVHINAVGAGLNHHSELDTALYKSAWTCSDHWAGVKTELAGLEKIGAPVRAELGEVIIGTVQKPDENCITVFQSLGMAVEDAAVANLIYKKYIQDIIIKQ